MPLINVGRYFLLHPSSSLLEPFLFPIVCLSHILLLRPF
nr:MAG TPA: hypothetical protein [Bacteriophage sp.]